MSGLVDILVGPITGILSRLIPDKDKREEMAHEIAMLVETQQHAQVMAQMEVNKQEAAHANLFVAGWRPGVGWVCVMALAWNFVIQPLLLWAAWMFPEYTDRIASAPRLDAGELMTVLLGMLGLGGMRSYEKRHGVARSGIGVKDDG